MADEPKKFELPEADANTIFGTPPADPLLNVNRPAPMRPVVPMREHLGTTAVRGFNDHLQTSKPKPAQLNPFDELQAANREHAQLVERLQALTNRLVGETPSFNAIEDEVPAAKPSGLMPLAASVAQLIQERSRHGVSLIDRIEENLG